MNIIEFAMARARRQRMTPEQAAAAIAAAQLLEKPRKTKPRKAGLSICWKLDEEAGKAGQGAVGLGSVWSGWVRRGEARAPMAQER